MTQSEQPKSWDFTIFCLGESKDPISRDNQIAGFQFVSPTISMKTWYIRLLCGMICWFTTIWSILSAVIAESTLETVTASSGEMFLLWFIFYTHWNLISQSIYWALIIYLHRKVYVNEQRDISTKEQISSRLFYIMKVFNMVGVGAGTGLSVIYWLFLYKPFTEHLYGEYVTIFFVESCFKHGICTVIILADFYISLSIWRYAKYIYNP